MITLPRAFTIYKALPIGFDLAYENLHMLQLEVNSSGVHQIRAATSTPYPLVRNELFDSQKAFARFIKNALNKRPFKGRKVTSYLPGSMTKLLRLDYAVNSNTTAEQEIIKGVTDRFGGTIDDFVIDYIQIRSDDLNAINRSALVAVAKKPDVISFLEILEGAGLDVVSLEVGPAALRRLVASLDKEKRYPSLLLINFGRVCSYLTVLSGRRLLMDREISFSENQLIETICSSLGLSERQARTILNKYGLGVPTLGLQDESSELEEILTATKEILKPIFLELTENINKSLIFLASETRGETVEKVYLLGSIARYPGAEEYIAEMFSIPVSVLHPLKHFKQASKNAVPKELDPLVSIAMATGLALRGFK